MIDYATLRQALTRQSYQRPDDAAAQVVHVTRAFDTMCHTVDLGGGVRSTAPEWSPRCGFSYENHMNEFGSQRSNMIKLCGSLPVRVRSSQYMVPIKVILMVRFPETAPVVYVNPSEFVPATTQLNFKVMGAGGYLNSAGMVDHPYIKHWQWGYNLTELFQQLQGLFAQNYPCVPVANRQPALPPVPPPVAQSYDEAAVPPPYSPGDRDTAGGRWHRGSAAEPPPEPPLPRQRRDTASSGGGTDGRPAELGAGMTEEEMLAAAMAASLETQMPVRQESGPSDDIIRSSLMSAVADKVRSAQRQAVVGVSIREKRATRDRLLGGKQELESKIIALDKELAEVESAMQWYAAQMTTMDRDVAELSRPAPPIDELVVPANPLFNQCLELEARRRALDNTIAAIELRNPEEGGLSAGLAAIQDLSQQLYKCSNHQRAVLDALRGCGVPRPAGPEWINI